MRSGRRGELEAADVKAAVLGHDLLDLAEDLGASGLTRSGGDHWRCVCFLHGGTDPNLVFSPSRGLWQCMSTCGGGDALTLVQRALGLDFRAALKWLADWAGVRPTDRDSLPVPRGKAWTPPAPEPDVTAETSFCAALWSAVADAPWSTPVTAWIAETRGIEPDAAYGLGCRDLAPVRDAVADIIHSTSQEVLEAVGMMREGRLHAALNAALSGVPVVAVPVWRLGKAYPERWRWRWVMPPAKRPKSDSPFASRVPADLLGMGRPGRLPGAEVRISTWKDDSSSLLVLTEGEPDWWAATEALNGRAIVASVCGSPASWRESWPPMSELVSMGVRRVAVCVHHGDPSKQANGLGHGERFACAVAAECLAAGLGHGSCIRKLAAEGRDLNDLHRAGLLGQWFEDVVRT